MHRIQVSIVYALKQQQWLKELTVQRGATVADLINQSNFLTEIDALAGQSVEDLSVGIYAQKASHEDLLEEGDRVEIYRPRLLQVPQDLRPVDLRTQLKLKWGIFKSS